MQVGSEALSDIELCYDADVDASLAELRQTPHTLRDIDSRIYLSCSQESYLSLAIEVALVGQCSVIGS